MLPNPPNAAPLSPLTQLSHSHSRAIPPPPPIPPPNTYTRRAVNAACNAARCRPRMLRRPLVHALLLYTADTAGLFAYARQVVSHFAERGIDVYLQTDVSVNGGSGGSLPIVADDVEAIVASSDIEFVVVLTDRNVPTRTVQARTNTNNCNTSFVERSLEEHTQDILQSWAGAIQRDTQASPQQLFSLGMNPNVVTNKHIDFFLQQHPVLSGIRSAYATLARLVDTTQKSAAISDPLQSQPDETNADVPESDSTICDGSIPDSDIARGDREGNVNEKASGKEKGEYEKLAKKALRTGLSDLLQQRPATEATGTNATDATCDNEDESGVLKSTSPNNMTMRWIKRSPDDAARMLRGQFLVRSLHSKLVDTFPTVAAAPVAVPHEMKPIPGTHTYTVPSEAHRQRLLREMNFLVVRMEELGSRLSRKPRKRRGRINPWTSYIDHFNNNSSNAQESANVGTDKIGNIDISKVHSFHIKNIHSDGAWRCTGCHTRNARNSTKCRLCGAPSCVLERGLLPTDSPAMDSCVREAMKASAREIRPWIFAPMPRRRTPPPIPISTTTTASTPTARSHALSTDSVHAAPFSLGSMSIPPIPPIPPPPPSLMEAFRGISLDDNLPPPRIPPPPPPPPPPTRSPPGLHTHFTVPNGSGISKVNAIPITNGNNYNHHDNFNRHLNAREIPCRSPGSAQFLHRRSSIHRRLMDDHRPSSFDATLLGDNHNPLHSLASPPFPAANRRPWIGAGNINGIGNGDHLASLGRSPPPPPPPRPMFGSINGYRGAQNNNNTAPDGVPMPFFDFEPQMQREEGLARSFFDDRRRDDGHERRGGFGLPPRLPQHYSNGLGHSLDYDYHQNNSNSVHSGGGGGRFPRLEQRTSLEDLAAASDAANGGLGSANAESIRAVMAYRADNEKEKEDKRKINILNGNHRNTSSTGTSGYGLF